MVACGSQLRTQEGLHTCTTGRPISFRLLMASPEITFWFSLRIGKAICGLVQMVALTAFAITSSLHSLSGKAHPIPRFGRFLRLEMGTSGSALLKGLTDGPMVGSAPTIGAMGN